MTITSARKQHRGGPTFWLVAASIIGALAASAASIGPAHAQSGSDDDEDALLVREARRAMSSQNYSEAAKLLDRALQVNPRRIDAYVLRAATHAWFKEHDKAVAVLTRARNLAPDNADVLTNLGSQLMLAKRPDEGAPILEKVVTSWPDRYEAHVSLGYHYAAEWRWNKAITAFEAYFKTRPSKLKSLDEPHQLELANAYLRSGDPKRARELYRNVLKARPGSALGRLGVAWSTAAIDCAAAIPLLRKLKDLAEDHAEVLIVQGQCALRLGKINEALATAEAYQKRRPDSAAAWALLGEARAAKKDIKGAVAALNQAAKREPKNQLYSLKLARVERMAGQPDKAVARLRKTGAPRGHEARWTVELGEALSDTGSYAEVRQLFAPYVEQHPKSAPAQALLGIAVYELGEPDEAIPHLQAALELDARESRVRAPLGMALSTVAIAAFKAGDLAKAESYLARAEAVRDDPITLRNLGAVRLAAGKADEAIPPLEKAVAALPDDDIALHLLGRAYHKQGNVKNASKVLRKAVRLARADSERGADVAIDLAAAQLADSDDDEALATLESGLKAAKGKAGDRVVDAYLAAARTVGTKAMLDGNFVRAYRVLNKVETEAGKRLAKDQLVALRCDMALAATGAAARAAAVRLLRGLGKARCPFAAPADELAVPILEAWNDGASARSARRALKRLESLGRKASGPAAALVSTAARDISVRAAIEAYDDGDIDRARFFLEAARKHDPNSVELDHNLAVLDLGAGKPDRAIPRLQRAAREVPEALVNLGIAYDLKGQPQEALEYYKRGRTAGARGANLKAWIDAKERLWGASKGGTP